MSPSYAVEQISINNMIRSLNPTLTVPSRRSVRRSILSSHATLQERLCYYLHPSTSTISLICDAWLSLAYLWYMVVTPNWIDSCCNIIRTILPSVRFRTPHRANAPCCILHELVSKWGVEDKFQSVMTDTAGILKVFEPLGKISMNRTKIKCTALVLTFTYATLRMHSK